LIIANFCSHLINDGVQESPPQTHLRTGLCSAQTDPQLHELFVDLHEANVGFKHWHPVSVTQNNNKLCGQGEIGGVWEWTSTVLQKHEGFKPMELYPSYTGKIQSYVLQFFSLTAHNVQLISLMENTTLFLADLGLHTQRLPVAKHCEFNMKVLNV
jgi:hypothetical protein